MQNNDKLSVGELIAVLIIATIIILLIVQTVYTYFPAKVDTYKIVNIEKVCKKSDCSWMVYTDKLPLQIQDLILISLWNSGDIANELEQHIGQYCTLKTRGARIPILSLYPNVVEIIKCSSSSAQQSR